MIITLVSTDIENINNIECTVMEIIPFFDTDNDKTKNNKSIYLITIKREAKHFYSLLFNDE